MEWMKHVELIKGYLNMDEAEALYYLAKKSKSVIVEIGSYCGRSTCALAMGSMAGDKKRVYAIDPHWPYTDYTGPDPVEYGPHDKIEFYKALAFCEVSEIVQVIQYPAEAFAPVCDLKIGLLFIDGRHEYENVWNDFLGYAFQIAQDGYLVFNDSDRPGVARVIERAHIERAKGQFETVECVGTITIMRPI